MEFYTAIGDLFFKDICLTDNSKILIRATLNDMIKLNSSFKNFFYLYLFN